MRTIFASELHGAALNNALQNAETADWQEHADTILPMVDKLIKKYGLEIVMIEISDDSYNFKIGKIEKKSHVSTHNV